MTDMLRTAITDMVIIAMTTEWTGLHPLVDCRISCSEGINPLMAVNLLMNH